MEIAETLAHYTRGALTLFFVLWCLRLKEYRNANMMTHLLFTATTWLSVCYLKDIALLFACWKESPFLQDLINIVDLTCVPLICSFFMEAVRPGLVTLRKTTILVSLQALFIPVYLLFPTYATIASAYITAAVITVHVLIAVLRFTSRHNRHIEECYSYTKGIDVKWVRNSCILFTLFYIGYFFAFHRTTWMGEAIYNIFSLGLWLYVFSFAQRHKVLDSLVSEEEDITDNDEDEDNDANKDTRIQEFIAARLAYCMEQERLWSNPKVSIYDVAASMGTNKTYLSDYLNHNLGTTFYDYINRFRIQKACSIIDAMSQQGRKSMSEVAKMSGFNSLSSFNRYFQKVKGMTPKEYGMREKKTVNQEKSAQ